MRIREVQKKPSKPRDPNAKAMQDLRKSGAAGSHGDKTKVIPRKQKHKDKDMKEGRDTHCSDKCCGSDVKREDCTCPPTCKHCNCNAKMETATPGATSAGNIATVANPHIANSKAKPKKQKPTDNALDNKSHGLFGQPIKRLNNNKEVTMDKNKELQENLADLASKAEQDHEVQMARAQLYKIAKYSIKLHDMLKGVSEQEGLEGWVQSKITKAADYMGAVYHNMDYEMKFDEVTAEAKEEVAKEGKAKNLKQQAAIAISKKEKGYKESLADKLAENLDLKKKTDQDTDESGIMYKAGVKKYGKDGMKKIQSAAGKGASAEEIGKIKDKHNKKKKESYSSLEESVGKEITEEEFEKLAEKQDACYHKVKSRYKVWPSAYASGALVQCRKKGAANWGKSKK